MDRSWILRYQNRFSAEYIDGVISFIDFAKANSGGAVLIRCPCNDCCNHLMQDYDTVRKHLHIKGMVVSYMRWIYHGEPIVQHDDSDESEAEYERVNEVAQQRHDALVQRIEEQSQPSVTTPMSEEEIAVDVLGKRSRYLNGYGIFTRSSSSSTQSRASQSELIALREQVAEQARRQAEQEKRQAEQDKRYHALEALVQQLASAAGMDPTGLLDITRGTTFAGDSTAIGNHDATLGGGGAHLGP